MNAQISAAILARFQIELAAGADKASALRTAWNSVITTPGLDLDSFKADVIAALVAR